MILRLLTPALLICWAVTGPVSAQAVPAGRPFVDSALTTAGERLKANPEYAAFMADSANQASPNPLMPAGALSFLPLSDSAMISVLRLLNHTLTQLPESACAQLLTGADFQGEGFLNWLASADRHTVEEWLNLFMGLALAIARHDPPHEKPSKEEGTRVMTMVVTGMSVTDQQRLVAGVREGNDTERCWAARQVFGGIGAQPEPDQLLALRAFFP